MDDLVYHIKYVHTIDQRPFEVRLTLSWGRQAADQILVAESEYFLDDFSGDRSSIQSRSDR